MRRQYRGNAQPTTLAAPVGLSDTTATLTDGSSYADGTVGPFTLTVDGGATGEEKWLVTSRTGNNLTGITRAYDGTPAASHSAGASVKHTISAVDLDEANAHGNDTTRDDHAQYGLFKKGLAALIGAAGRSGKLYYKTDLDYLTVDDGSTFHDFQSKAVADGAYPLRTELAVAEASVAAFETGTGGSYADLTTVGPDVAFVAPASGKVRLDYSFRGQNNTAGVTALASPAVVVSAGGAVTVVQDDMYAATVTGPNAYNPVATGYRIISGLTPGTNYTARLSYKVGAASTGTWGQRRMTVTKLSV